MRREIGIEDWETHLRGLADARLPGEWSGIPEPFELRMEGVRGAPSPPDARLDEALWWSVLDPSRDPLPLIQPVADGPLFTQETSRTIEVWTERELCGMHALSWTAMQRGRDAVRDRLHACAQWHITNTQPDNATNRPWASHVFLLLAHYDENPSARLYAETLIHNCQTNHGVPDTVSGLILLDSADALRAEIESA